MKEEVRAGWVRTLERLRYDITQSDPLRGHKEYDSRHAVDVTLDASGQLRMTITRQVQETRGETVISASGKPLRVFREQHALTIVNYRLQATDDLTTVLREMEKV